MRSELDVAALVLAGGRGRRMAPYSTNFPKPLAPVGDLPIIEIVLRQLRWYGVRDITISLGHLGELIEAYFATRNGLDKLNVTFVREASPLGTAGPLGLLGAVDRNVLVVNGDVLTTFDYSTLIDFHLTHSPDLSIAVHQHRVTVDLGVVEVDDHHSVKRYTEKPSFDFDCAMGINVYSPAAVQAVGHGEALDFPDLVRRLLDRGANVVAHRTDCFWSDIGRREDYERANDEFESLREQLLPDERDPEPQVSKGRI
jgi:NDP-sugar pyrophosphorylase family protein